jgi:hypothetical protein
MAKFWVRGFPVSRPETYLCFPPGDEGDRLKGGARTPGPCADLTMTMRYAHISQGHLQAAVSAIDDLGKVDTKLTLNAPKSEGADSLSLAKPL